jgi:hypothetical protein
LCRAGVDEVEASGLGGEGKASCTDERFVFCAMALLEKACNKKGKLTKVICNMMRYRSGGLVITPLERLEHCPLAMINRQKIVLFTTKYLSYIINTTIILLTLGAVGGWLYMLYLSAL